MNVINTKFIKTFLASSLFGLFSPCLFGDAKISNLDDFNFGLYSGFGNLRNNDNICINAIPLENYQVTFWGSGAGGAFEVSNGVDTLAYRVRFNDRPRRRGGTTASPGIPIANQNNASDDLDCPGGLNANIDIRFRRRDLQAANPGRYIGLLTVTVIPE
ncbi:hypothetical protein [Aliikangiella coralliicola]|uniref:Spore coat protein U domain-containing protein n=1 Tax=Aliikangiella coralliicola TaxID=2592383 RepID=A0A545UHT3_9GAMM|nr:hypothetical protein [Aliikangiella coralliicola]TQV89034.1 hypothetical protein FLL46_05755 [Aliikangiella coralliicola]